MACPIEAVGPKPPVEGEGGVVGEVADSSDAILVRTISRRWRATNQDRAQRRSSVSRFR
jgi:hypothetical protein